MVRFVYQHIRIVPTGAICFAEIPIRESENMPVSVFLKIINYGDEILSASGDQNLKQLIFRLSYTLKVFSCQHVLAPQNHRTNREKVVRVCVS